MCLIKGETTLASSASTVDTLCSLQHRVTFHIVEVII